MTQFNTILKPKPSVLRRIAGSLESMGQLRDGLLVAASLLYITGYGVWSVTAWKNHLGPLPALDAQYFVAGFPVALFILMCIAILWKLSHFLLRHWPAYVSSRKRWQQRVIIAISLIVCIASIVVYILYKADQNHKYIAFTAVFVAWIACVLLYQSDIHPSGAIRLPATILRYATYGLIAIAFVFLSATYIDLVYSKIPQALGGAKPRVAQFDVKVKDVSRQTLTLLHLDAWQNAETVLRTEPINVVFGSRDWFLVRPAGASGDSILVELPRSAVSGVTWRSR